MVPWLSPEVTTLIIQHSLPRPSYGSYRQRADLLLACSLVDQTWGSLAQEELFKNVVIESLDAATRFIATREEGVGVELPKRVRSLRVGKLLGGFQLNVEVQEGIVRKLLLLFLAWRRSGSREFQA